MRGRPAGWGFAARLHALRVAANLGRFHASFAAQRSEAGNDDHVDGDNCMHVEMLVEVEESCATILY